jgi:hypothetical protein
VPLCGKRLLQLLGWSWFKAALWYDVVSWVTASEGCSDPAVLMSQAKNWCQQSGCCSALVGNRRWATSLLITNRSRRLRRQCSSVRSFGLTRTLLSVLELWLRRRLSTYYIEPTFGLMRSETIVAVVCPSWLHFLAHVILQQCANFNPRLLSFIIQTKTGFEVFFVDSVLTLHCRSVYSLGKSSTFSYHITLTWTNTSVFGAILQKFSSLLSQLSPIDYEGQHSYISKCYESPYWCGSLLSATLGISRYRGF